MTIDQYENIGLYPDGDQWCARCVDQGPNMMTSDTGFGPTKADALRALADELEAAQ